MNSPRETTVDIVLDVSKNSHGNVVSERLRKVVGYQHGFVNSSRSNQIRFSEDRRGFYRLSTKLVNQH